MFVLEYKLKGKEHQYRAIDEAIRTCQFVRNKSLRFWMDNKATNKYDLNKYCAVLAKEYEFANELNSTARQAAAERAWSSISRFYDNCKKQVKGKKGFPQFKKNTRSVEYKHSGWKLDEKTKKHITFTDKKGIGRLKLVGSRDICFYSPDEIKRVRLIKRADGYYCQFLINIEVKVKSEPTGNTIGIDVGLKYFYADSNGNIEPIPQFYRKAEKQLNRLNRIKSNRFKKGKTPSNRYQKARNKYARKHLDISRQREEFAKRVTLRLIQSNDLIAYENLNVKGLVRTKLAKSITDAAWSTFRKWLEYFGIKYGKLTIAVCSNYTSQTCPKCGNIAKKSLSTRTHICGCGCVLDRDVAAAIVILQRALEYTVGHTGINAQGDGISTLIGQDLLEQVLSLN